MRLRRAGLRVCFSDFNREVLEQVTIPNVRLNVEERHWPLAEFFSGDWGSLSPLLEEVMRAVLAAVVATRLRRARVGGARRDVADPLTTVL